MPEVNTTQFLDGLRASRLLDESRIGELQARPEAAWDDVEFLANYARERGWLTAFQARELQEGRGHQLNVGGYQIFDKLDVWPGGTTFKALHPAIHQPVALRVLNSAWLAPADTTPDYVARAQAASLAQSPHLANVLDAGTFGDEPYIVQEYVDGTDLFHLVNEMGALPIGLACEYARQAALALQAIHSRSVAHGDVSPHTFLLTPVKRATGTNGDVSIRPRPGATIKLAELALCPRRPPISEFTYGESDRIGPLAFVPPERLHVGDATIAGDLFGLGATLYFLLSTRPPHAGETPLSIMLNLQQVDPVPIEKLKSDVPAQVADLVSKLLSRNPYTRPAAAEVAEILLPYCEPSAMPAAEASPILITHETFTQPTIPTAVPVARDLDRTDMRLDNGPFAEAIAEAPIAEPLPEVQPLDHGYDVRGLVPEIQPLDDSHSDHAMAFGHSAMGGDKPRAPRPKAKASPKQKLLIAVGLCLHLIATTMCLGWMGVIPNPFAAKSPTTENAPVEKKDTTKTKKPKKN